MNLSPTLKRLDAVVAESLAGTNSEVFDKLVATLDERSAVMGAVLIEATRGYPLAIALVMIGMMAERRRAQIRDAAAPAIADELIACATRAR